MLLMAVLPICVFAKEEVRLHVSKGGTDTQNAPTINYVRMVFLPVLRRMGLDASVTVHKYGYYPKGMGEVTLTVMPCQKLEPIRLERFGNLAQRRLRRQHHDLQCHCFRLRSLFSDDSC